MLRDNLAGLSEPMLSSARAYPLALCTDRNESSDDRPQDALKIPARQGGIYTLAENVASPFHAEPPHRAGAGGLAHGAATTPPPAGLGAPFGPWCAIRSGGLHCLAEEAWYQHQHESARKCLRQCHGGEFYEDAQV